MKVSWYSECVQYNEDFTYIDFYDYNCPELIDPTISTLAIFYIGESGVFNVIITLVNVGTITFTFSISFTNGNGVLVVSNNNPSILVSNESLNNNFIIKVKLL